MPKVEFRYRIVEVDRIGSTEVAYSRDPIEAFRARDAIEATTGQRERIVVVEDVLADAEGGRWLDEDSAIGEWLAGLADCVFLGVVHRYTSVNYGDGSYDKDGALIRADALDALYDALYGRALPTR